MFAMVGLEMEPLYTYRRNNSSCDIIVCFEFRISATNMTKYLLILYYIFQTGEIGINDWLIKATVPKVYATKHYTNKTEI